MPTLIESGPARMLELATASGLVEPLRGYRVYVLGASPSGLTLKKWTALQMFWKMYFSAAGVQLVSYSVECDAGR